MWKVSIIIPVLWIAGCSIFDPRLKFYGKLIDQNGDPVQGAHVTYHVSSSPTIPAPMVGPSSKEFVTSSNSDGRIAADVQGIRFWIDNLVHPQYLFAPGIRTFLNRYELPNNTIWPTGEMSPNNPVIIPAWKIEDKVQLIKAGKALAIMHERATAGEIP